MSTKRVDVTDEHKKYLPEIKEKWKKVVTSTEAGDKSVAEEGFCVKYNFDKIELPKYILWTRSPRASLCLAAIIQDKIGNEDTIKFMEEIAETGRFPADERVTVDSVEKLRNETWRHDYTRICLSVPQEWFYRDSVFAQEYGQASLNKVRNDFAYGQFDAHWLAFFNFFRDVVGVKEELEIVKPELDYIADNASWWASYAEGVVIATEKMCHVSFDDNGDPHGTDRAAVEFRDKFGIYLWHRVHVPENFILRPDLITVERIENESNEELKRIMLDIFTPERYIQESNAEVVNDDPRWGKLLRRQVPGTQNEPICFLMVKNSTPEKDGSIKTYMLRTDPNADCAKRAQWLAASEPCPYEEFDLPTET